MSVLGRPVAEAAELTERREQNPGRVLLLVCLAQFMVLLDVSVVNVALPSIGSELHYGGSDLQWVINAYTVAFAGCLLLGGRLADLIGHRRVFLLGLAVFGGASLLGGLAQNSAELTLARTLQGIGGAILSPATLTIVIATFEPGASRQKALAIWNAVGGAGGALGGIAGGVITDFLGWRWVLMINVPIAVLAAGAALRVLSARVGTGRGRVSLLSAVLATGGLASFNYAVIQTADRGWLDGRTVGFGALGIAMLVGFVAEQRRAGDQALLPLRLLANRPLAVSTSVMLLAGATFFSMWFFLSLFFQQVLGYGPLGTGLLFLPMGAGIIGGSILSARFAAAYGVRAVTIAGLLIALAGFLLLTQLADGHSYALVAVIGGTAAAAGIGVSFPPLTAAATRASTASSAGLISGLLNTARQVGGSLGLAVMTTVAATAGWSEHRTAGAAAAEARGISAAFVVAALLAATAAVLSWALPSGAAGSARDTAVEVGEPDATATRQVRPVRPS